MTSALAVGDLESLHAVIEDDWLPDDYRMVSLLSAGGFSQVYLVQHEETGKYYALKRIQKSAYPPGKELERLLNERRALRTSKETVSKVFQSEEQRQWMEEESQQETRFLCGLQEWFEDDTSCCLLLDFAQGGDLFNLLQMVGCFDETEAAFYFAEMCTAIRALHSRGFIHRDLKPRNWLIKSDGHLCLTDFGLSKGAVARLADSSTDLGRDPSRGVSRPVSRMTRRDRRQLERGLVTPTLHIPEECPATLGPAFKALDEPEFACSIVGTASYMAPEVALVGWAQQVILDYDESQSSWSSQPPSLDVPMLDPEPSAFFLNSGSSNDFFDAGVSPNDEHFLHFSDGVLDSSDSLLGSILHQVSPDVDRHHAARVLEDAHIDPRRILGLAPNAPVPNVFDGYNRSCDFWSLGCLLFELMSGEPPFSAPNPLSLLSQLQQNGVKPPYRPDFCSDAAWDLLCHLIAPLSTRIHTTRELRAHPFFQKNEFSREELDRPTLLLQRTPPWVPQLEGPEDLRFFFPDQTLSQTPLSEELPPSRFSSPRGTHDTPETEYV